MRHRLLAPLGLAGLLLFCASACSDDDKPPPADSGPDAPLVDASDDGAPRPDSAVCTYKPDGGDEAIPIPPIHTPRWAFAPWISKDISDGPDTYAFVEGFKTRDIPVGVVVIDSPWETNYNTFVPNPGRYPDFKKMVDDLHAQDVKIVLWITQTVNAASFDLETGGDTYDGPSPNYAEGEACGFYINDGQKYTWWKGFGSGVDFFNPLARQWWHAQQDTVLAMGIDGWKLDFGEEYVGLKDVLTHEGKKPLQAYSEKYYEDFLAYGVHKRGKDFVTMVRGYDKSYQWPGRFFARPEHAPVVWAGDNRRDWVGLADALDHMFRSAAAGYVVVGSDIGGYLDFDDVDPSIDVPFDQDNFVRWVAVGALSPFMQLHGRGNLTPWTVTPKTQETIAIYRYWSWFHQQLVPFFYSLAESAYRDKAPVILRPIGAEASWAGDYRYTLGEAFFVAPLLDGTGKRDVALPAGVRYYDWWKPQDGPIDGGQTLAAYDATDQQRIPLFVREGAIIPMDVENDVTGTGTTASKGALTVLVYPAAQKSSFALRDDDEQVTEITAEGLAPTGTTVTLARVRAPTILRVRTDSPPIGVQLGGQAQSKLADRAAFDGATSGWWYDASLRATWIKLAKQSGSATVTLAY